MSCKFLSAVERTIARLKSFQPSLMVIIAILVAMPARAEDLASRKKKVVMIAGTASHGYGSHEHYAGCRLLADVVHSETKDIVCELVQNGWPSDESILEDADSIVIYSDGGAKHPALPHLASLGKHMERGAGLVCIHYAVEVPIGDAGERFKDWLGGYFETDWSVNPHWVANFKNFNDHPTTRGVKPFSANDEWYFHMRFRDGMKGVTPILSDVPPESTMNRKDGHHSGNPAVRKAVAEKQPQHVAWAYERENGGRSFGFTGGHFHWNWGNPEMQRVVANAIAWTAKADVPTAGVATSPIPFSKLKDGQDEPIPAKFVAERTIEEFKLTP